MSFPVLARACAAVLLLACVSGCAMPASTDLETYNSFLQAEVMTGF
jgi:hypothetical protein